MRLPSLTSERHNKIQGGIAHAIEIGGILLPSVTTAMMIEPLHIHMASGNLARTVLAGLLATTQLIGSIGAAITAGNIHQELLDERKPHQ